MLRVVVTEVQSPVVTDHVVRLRLERDQSPSTLVLLLGLDSNVVQRYHGLRHGVVGRVHVNPETREAPVKVSREIVGINVLAVEDAWREKVRKAKAAKKAERAKQRVEQGRERRRKAEELKNSWSAKDIFISD